MNPLKWRRHVAAEDFFRVLDPSIEILQTQGGPGSEVHLSNGNRNAERRAIHLKKRLYAPEPHGVLEVLRAPGQRPNIGDRLADMAKCGVGIVDPVLRTRREDSWPAPRFGVVDFLGLGDRNNGLSTESNQAARI